MVLKNNQKRNCSYLLIHLKNNKFKYIINNIPKTG